MPRRFTCLAILILLAITDGSALAAEVNGELTTIDGVPVLRVWGSYYEMGYAQGYLVGDQLKALFDDFVIPYLQLPVVYNVMRTAFLALYTVPPQFAEEAQGVVDGAIAAGMDPYSADLGRDLDANDIALIGSMADLAGLFGCSSLIAWGDATLTEPELVGEPAVSRNLDWVAIEGDPTLLPRATLVVARTPDDGRPTVSITFPGFLGCLSCMNDAGVSALQQQSWPYTDLADLDRTDKFVPINLAMRIGLEDWDYDGDSVVSIADESAAVMALPRSSPYNVVCVDAAPTQFEPFIVEADNHGETLRYAADDPAMPPQTLAVTNAMRKLSGPYPCVRYAEISRQVNEWQGQVTYERMWSLMGDIAMTDEGYWKGWLTAQTMIFVPKQRRIGLAWADQTAMTWDKEPIWLDWEDLFPVADDDTADDDATPDDDSVDDDVTPDDDAAGDDDDDNDNGCGC